MWRILKRSDHNTLAIIIALCKTFYITLIVVISDAGGILELILVSFICIPLVSHTYIVGERLQSATVKATR